MPYGQDEPNGPPEGIAAFSIDASSGALTFNPTSTLAYLGSFGGPVQVYSCDAATGTLTPVSQFDPDGLTAASSIVFSPDGLLAFAVFPVSLNVFEFAVDSSTGAFTTIGSALSGNAVYVDSAGTAIYLAGSVAVNGPAYPSAYSIDPSTDALTAIGATPIVGTSLSIDPSGAFLYTTGTRSGVYAFSISGASGALTALSGSPLFAGNGGDSIVTFKVP